MICTDDPDDVGRYADLAAGKKVRAPDETELSEKEMKYLLRIIVSFYNLVSYLYFYPHTQNWKVKK